MNVFVIPSWYPSPDYLLNGIFVKEQTIGLCTTNPSINAGVSLWGQKDNQHLLWASNPVKSILKLATANATSMVTEILPNLKEYTKPTFTWTRKINKGNIKNVIKANYYNLKAFEAQFGPADIIHAHVGYPAGYIAMEISRVTGIPYIITEHMGPFPSYLTTNRKGSIRSFYMQPYLHAAANIAVSPSHAAALRKHQIPRVQVLSNFTDEITFKPNAPEIQPAVFTFFTLSRITPLKGIDLLLHAIRELRKRTGPVKFRIGGSGSHTKVYKQLAETLGIAGDVEWLGELTREQALKEFQNCQAFILPSLYESMGVVYIEALACGKPIIATKCGGPESIVTSFNGLLVEKNNPEALAAAMLNMMKNYKSYDSHIIRQDFMDRFSSRAVLPQLLQIYQKVIDNYTYKP